LAYDKDGDGRNELIIGIPDENIGSIKDAGAALLLYGGSNGLTSVDEFYSQESGAFEEAASAGDRFGASLVSANIMDNGSSRIFVGVPGQNSIQSTSGVHGPVAAELPDGRYEGVMKSPLSQFGVDSTDTAFEINGTGITITQEHFFGETCIFNGTVSTLLTASGTYRCSDFTEGTWSSSKMAKTSSESFIAELDVDDGQGGYVAKYSGFLVGDASLPILDNFVYYYKSGSHNSLGGTYVGVHSTSGLCANSTFPISSSDTSIAITGNTIEINRDSFFDGTCIFSGEIINDPFHAEGTYRCSNFDEGTWESERIVATGTDSFFAELIVNVPDRGCEYTAKYIGFSD
jgi:hypothetical protein